jgi:hypothetical protein
MDISYVQCTELKLYSIILHLHPCVTLDCFVDTDFQFSMVIAVASSIEDTSFEHLSFSEYNCLIDMGWIVFSSFSSIPLYEIT